MKWFFAAFRQYANFRGRASRTEFWMFMLFNSIVLLVLVGLILTLGHFFPRLFYHRDFLFVFVVIATYLSVVIIPMTALTVRRLHDTERGAEYLLYAFLPIVGWLIQITILCCPSDEGENDYGVPPLTEPIVPKNSLRQKALIGLIITSLLMASVSLLFYAPMSYYPFSYSFFLGLLMYTGWALMGITFLQKRDFSRFVGLWLLIHYVLIVILSLVHKFIYLPDSFSSVSALLLYTGDALRIIFFIQLIRKKRLAPLTDYTLLASTAIYLYLDVASFIGYYRVCETGYIYYGLYQLGIETLCALLFSISCIVYAIANRREQKALSLKREREGLPD